MQIGNQLNVTKVIYFGGALAGEVLICGRAGRRLRQYGAGLFLVFENFAALRCKIGAACKNGSGSDSEAVGVLMNGRMQLGKDRLHLASIFRGNGVIAKLPNAVIEASSAQAHKQKVLFPR